MSKSTLAQIKELEIRRKELLSDAVSELKKQLKAARKQAAMIQAQITRLTNKKGDMATRRRTRTRVTIEQIREAIIKGAKNHKEVAAALHCSRLQIAQRLKAEGRKAGIYSEGRKSTTLLKVK